MNLWEEKINIGRSIYDIGPGKTVTLHYNEDTTEDDVIPDPPVSYLIMVTWFLVRKILLSKYPRRVAYNR